MGKIGKLKPLNAEERRRIIDARKAGVNVKDLMRRFNRERKTIMAVLAGLPEKA